MDEGITIVIPTKDAARTINACLDSIAHQTKTPDAVVVVNDFSSDETVALAKSLPARFPIRVMENRRYEPHDGRGAAIARNVGAAVVTTPYLFFCDADVLLASDALENLLQALTRHPDASFAYGPFSFGRLFRAPRFSRRLLRLYNYISTMSLIRTAAFPGFDESLARYQDWDLWLRMTEAGHRGIRVRRPLFTAPAMAPHAISGKADGILEASFRTQRGLPKNTRLLRFYFKAALRIMAYL